MIRPLHESDHIVGPDGTLSLRSLKPGARVHVTIIETDASDPEWGPGPLPGTRVYRPNQPRLPWGALAGTVLKYEKPFEPACDPNDWDANG